MILLGGDHRYQLSLMTDRSILKLNIYVMSRKPSAAARSLIEPNTVSAIRPRGMKNSISNSMALPTTMLCILAGSLDMMTTVGKAMINNVMSIADDIIFVFLYGDDLI